MIKAQEVLAKHTKLHPNLLRNEITIISNHALKAMEEYADLKNNKWIGIEVGLPNENVEVKVKVDCKHNGNGIIEPKYNAKYNHISKQWESGLSTLYFVTHWKLISTTED